MNKFLKFTLAILCLLILVDVSLVFGFARFQPEVKKSDAIIILGAAINSPALYNRTLRGLELYNQGKADVLVLSGGRISDKDLSEAGYMKKVILQNTDTPPKMILDESSGTTEENLRNSRALIPEAQSVIIVSDEFHLSRGVLLALRNGFYPIYWSSPNPEYYPKSELFFYYFRELVALISYIPTLITNR